MASNKCIKCNSTKPKFGKCPVCEDWTGSVPVADSGGLVLTGTMFQPFCIIANVLCLIWAIMCPILLPNNPDSEFLFGSLVFAFLWLPMTIVAGPSAFGVIDYRKSSFVVFGLILSQILILSLLVLHVGNTNWLSAMVVPSSIAVIAMSMRHRQHQAIFTSYLMTLTVVYGTSAFLKFDPLGRLVPFQAIVVSPLVLLIPLTSTKILNSPNRLVPTFTVITLLVCCAVSVIGLQVLKMIGMEITFRLMILFVLSLLGLLSIATVSTFRKIYNRTTQIESSEDSDSGIGYALKVFGTFVITVLVALYFAINGVISAADYSMKRDALLAQQRAEAAREHEEQVMLRELARQAERDRIENEKRRARQEFREDTAEAISEGIKRSRRN